MIKAEVRFGEGHYKVLAANAGHPFLKVMIFSLIVLGALILMTIKSIRLAKYNAWLLLIYALIFIAVNGYTLVRIVLAILGAKKSALEASTGEVAFLTFDEEEVVFCIDRGFEDCEKHLKYPAVKLAEKRGDWFIVTLKEDKIVFSGSEITEGDTGQLTALLSEKMGERFHNKKEVGK